MKKVELLYGKYGTKAFLSLAIYFCSMAKSKLKKHLHDLVRTEGLSNRIDEVDKAIHFWDKRLNEFKEMK